MKFRLIVRDTVVLPDGSTVRGYRTIAFRHKRLVAALQNSDGVERITEVVSVEVVKERESDDTNIVSKV